MEIELDYPMNQEKTKSHILYRHMKKAWSKIGPFWPLRNLIAINPLLGFEDLPFEDALMQAKIYFQKKHLPEPMQTVNRETIKWLQVFFDSGQATLKMPMRHLGLLKALQHLLPFDKLSMVHKKWLENLSGSVESLIQECLLYLGISPKDSMTFMTLMLSTLPGWASYVQYRTTWADLIDQNNPYPLKKEDYLAFRLLITCVFWPDAKMLLKWHACEIEKEEKSFINIIEDLEKKYEKDLFKKISKQKPLKKEKVNFQVVFCIDVRSEPFRRALEAQGFYQTFGFAGFFGIPLGIENTMTAEAYASCPVLLKPKHYLKQGIHCLKDGRQKHKQLLKRLYQSLKYTFISPFALAETLGIASGLWMFIRNFFPNLASSLQKKTHETYDPLMPSIEVSEYISFEDQCTYAEGALGMMGLSHFAPLVVFCGHGSTTQNNAYATALDCGACGGRHGGTNARVLAEILNKKEIRLFLAKKDIFIPETTCFLAAEHNTTTDRVELYDEHVPQSFQDQLLQLKSDLKKAGEWNSQWRCSEMGVKPKSNRVLDATKIRSQDWAEVRPEWGLARNAAFIVGPRALTEHINLEGRAFLHSYDWTQDPKGLFLKTILTAPMVVAHWINSQYLFSTLDNVAFGGGSKITKNITGKIGIMQGNASDLMHGLPLQSVFKTDYEAYHKPLRLLTLIQAPRALIESVIAQEKILKKLFSNGWVILACIEPQSHELYKLHRDLTWAKAF